jgi:hypothetical protein
MSDDPEFNAAMADWKASFDKDWWFAITRPERGVVAISFGLTSRADPTYTVERPAPASDAEMIRAAMGRIVLSRIDGEA